MSGLNSVQIIGNLGNTPETKTMPNGNTVTNFRVAVSRKYKDGEGNAQEETEWFSVVTFGKLAETVAQYLTKGRQVYVGGRLKTNSWDDKDTGEKKYRTEIIGSEVQFLGQSKERELVGASSSAADTMPF